MDKPMTYQRLVRRNQLRLDYWRGKKNSVLTDDICTLIAFDLCQLAQDQRDEPHLQYYARLVGITPAQVKQLLDSFFDGDV